MREMDGLPVLGCEQTSFLSHDIVMMSYRNNLAKPVARLIKVGLDLVLASIGLVVLSPLLLIIAALVKLDGGPVLFAHKRIGSDGIAFRCLKFRTMVPNASQVLQELLERDPDAAEEWVNTQKLRNDPRITRVGAWLRKASLDELPQLLNVLRLEMSLVGPRPIVEAEAEKYGDDFAFYCETRPGITGLWQVSGRSDTTYAYRVQLDCWYVKNWTVWNDLAIIARTVPTVLTRRGAV
jgi:undecaprenyl-phosphate galactose phosphotransferase